MTLTPSQTPPAKRVKPEPTALINVKEEAGMAKASKMVITPEVSYDGEESANTTNDQVKIYSDPLNSFVIFSCETHFFCLTTVFK